MSTDDIDLNTIDPDTTFITIDAQPLSNIKQNTTNGSQRGSTTTAKPSLQPPRLPTLSTVITGNYRDISLPEINGTTITGTKKHPSSAKKISSTLSSTTTNPNKDLFYLPNEYYITNPTVKISSNSYDADDIDEEFITEVNTKRITTVSDLHRWSTSVSSRTTLSLHHPSNLSLSPSSHRQPVHGAKRTKLDDNSIQQIKQPSGSSGNKVLVSPVNSKKTHTLPQTGTKSTHSSSSSSTILTSFSTSSSNAILMINLTGLEKAIEILERESFAEGSRKTQYGFRKAVENNFQEANIVAISAIKDYHRTTLPTTSTMTTDKKEEISFKNRTKSTVHNTPSKSFQRLPVQSRITDEDTDTEMVDTRTINRKSNEKGNNRYFSPKHGGGRTGGEDYSLSTLSEHETNDAFVTLERARLLLKSICTDSPKDTTMGSPSSRSKKGGDNPTTGTVVPTMIPFTITVNENLEAVIFGSNVIDIMYHYWLWKRTYDGSLVAPVLIPVSTPSHEPAVTNVSNTSTASAPLRPGALLRCYQTIALGDLPIDTDINMLAHIIGLDSIRVLPLPPGVPIGGTSTIINNGSLGTTSGTTSGRKTLRTNDDDDNDGPTNDDEVYDDEDEDDDNQTGEIDSNTTKQFNGLTLYSPRGGILTYKARQRDIQTNERALMRLRMLRHAMEKLRILIDLARKREKVRRNRLTVINNVVQTMVTTTQEDEHGSGSKKLSTGTTPKTKATAVTTPRKNTGSSTANPTTKGNNSYPSSKDLFSYPTANVTGTESSNKKKEKGLSVSITSPPAMYENILKELGEINDTVVPNDTFLSPRQTNVVSSNRTSGGGDKNRALVDRSGFSGNNSSTGRPSPTTSLSSNGGLKKTMKSPKGISVGGDRTTRDNHYYASSTTALSSNFPKDDIQKGDGCIIQ